jgi:hypothetical protein
MPEPIATRGPSPMMMINLYYLGIKLVFFFGLVRCFAKYDVLKPHILFLSLLYTGGVAFLSWVFIMAPREAPDYRSWEIWLAKTFVLTLVYFWLLRRFDEGLLFFALLIAGVALVYY